MKRITTGMETMRLRAAYSFQKMFGGWTRLEIPTGSVKLRSWDMNVNARSHSFHAERNENRAVTASAGSDSGRMTRRNADPREHPSTLAASSRSLGIVSK